MTQIDAATDAGENGTDQDAEPSDELARALAAPDIGEQLRQRRQEMKISLRGLARRVDVSPSLISQVERGLAMPSVSTLYSITRVLELSLDDLFGTAGAERSNRGSLRNGDVAHDDERPVIKLADGITWERLAGDTDAAVEMIHSVYPPGTESCPHDGLIRHSGRETGYVISGTLTVDIGFRTVVLQPGDSVTFESTTPHRLANDGDEDVRAVWLIVDGARVAGEERAH